MTDREAPLDLDGLVEDVMEWLRRSDGRLEDIFALWTQGKRDARWTAEKLIAEGHLAALQTLAAKLREQP